MIIISLLLLSNSLYSIEESKIPSSLIDWKEWVLDDIKDRECPISYQTGKPQCSWYRDISVSLNNQKLDFNMSVTLYRDKTKITLPSAHLSWVESVMINGEKAIVMDSNSKATLIQNRGTYVITGSIAWRENLKYLQLPPSVALVKLYKNTKEVSASVDQNARLWLDKTDSTKTEKGTLAISLYRKIVDAHPLQMNTYLHLSVSGKMRSVILDGVVLDGFLPTAISSQLDATITEDKKLKVEVKAGEWKIMLDSYSPQNRTKLSKPNYTFPYANQEIWSLQTNPNYRTVEIEGVKTIDPSQTTLPKEWKSLPAYLIGDRALTIKELYKSAKQHQKNEFKLRRQVWLDFDGGGYTISDHIDAKISELRRLEATKILNLASVSINSKPTLITMLNSKQKGVELREENLNIEASSRYEGDISLLPISAWDEKFDSVMTTLHLPAGWRLFASFGSDSRTNAWLDRWDLMDIFLVMLLGIAIYKLYGWRWAIPATLFIILLWHESDAPTTVWLFVLVLVALLRLLKEGRLRGVIKVLMAVVVGITVLKVLSFSVQEIRTALYPQLEKEYQSVSISPRGSMSIDNAEYKLDSLRREKSLPYQQRNMPIQNSYVPKKISKSKSQIMQNRVDPNAVVQTGIAKPTWSWSSHNFSWQSVVGSSDRLELWLISPTLTKAIKVLRIMGMLFLLYMFLREFTRFTLSKLDKNEIKALLVLLLLTLTPNTLDADIPSEQMLEQLKLKLNQPPTCLPNCASIESVEMNIVDNILEINANISAGADVSVPIFGNRNRWLPTTAIVDSKRADLNIDNSGGLWIMLKRGTHKITLRGSIKGYEQIMLSSALSLHNLKAFSRDDSWQISSDYKSYIEINNLQEQKEREKEKSKIEPIVELTRTLYFGQRWYIDTEVKLLNRIERPKTLLYTLLPNESILDKEIETKDKAIVLHLDNKNSYYRWRSSIPITDTLELSFAQNSKEIEIWQMDISSIWNITYTGIEPIEQLKVGSILMPRFKPWQGEKLKLSIKRAKAVRGESLTIESSRLKITQSNQYRDMRLDLNLKSSKAGQYSITLDGVTNLQPTEIDGKNHYLKISNGKVSIPLQAKLQKIKLSWREEIKTTQNYKFPHIDLSKHSVNSSIELTLPQNRWILWTDGPTLGPAVLLWGVLLAVLLFALILGRVKGTPLKSRDWLLLGLGVSTTSILIMLPIVIWIFLLRFREQKNSTLKEGRRNFIQVVLVILTFVALLTIIGAVSAGLLSNPDMMIVGNNSYGNYLNWYSDRISTTLAEPTVISVSIWYYRALMLLWAIWIAFSLIGWLKWAWEVFSKGDIWVRKENE